MRWIDAQMFRVASYLLPIPADSSNLRIIQLDEARLQKPDGIKDFRYILRKLRKSKAAEIVWLTDDFPQQDYVQEKNVDEIKSTSKKSNILKKKASNKSITSSKANAHTINWIPAEGERNKLAWMLEKQNVFLTQYGNMPKQHNNITYDESLVFQKGWRKYIPTLFLPSTKKYLRTQTESVYRIYPFDYRESEKKSLIWYGAKSTDSVNEIFS